MNQIPERPSDNSGMLRTQPSAAPTGSRPAYGRRTMPADREMRARDYVAILRRHILLLTVIVVPAVAGVAVWTMLRPDFYDARTRIEIGTPSNGADTKDSPVASVGPNPVQFNTQLQFLSSPLMLRRVVETLHLDNDPAFLRHMTTGGRKLRALLRLTYVGPKETAEMDGTPLTPALSPGTSDKDLQKTRRLERFTADLFTRLTIFPVMETRSVFKETRLVDIVFRHPNPLLAAKVSNAVADLFVAENRALRNDSHVRTTEYLSARALELESQIRTDEQKMAGYEIAPRSAAADETQNVALDRLTVLNKQLLEAENEHKIAEANYKSALAPEAAKSIAEETARTVLNEAAMKLADLRGKRAQLLAGVTEEWPEVRELNQQILSLEKDIREIRAQALETARAALDLKFRQAAVREDALRAAFQTQRGLVHEQNRAAVDGRLIKQRIEINRQLLTQLLKQLGETDMPQPATAQDCRVVEYAAVPNPDDPAGPWRLAYIGGAAGLSLLLAGAAVFIREAFDQRLRSGDDVEAVLQVPPIAMIRSGVAVRRATSELSLHGGASGKLSDSPELLPSGNCSPGFVEDYRKLRTSLLLSMESVPKKSILVTSSAAGEGATTTAVNVAVSLAQTGARVLLVDADIRHPRIHAIFDVPNTSGLSTMLSDAACDAATGGVLHNAHAAGVDLLTAGPASVRAAELLGSPQMQRLLRRAEGSYTHVVIDSPAVSSCTDAVILSSMTDGLLLVIQASKTSRELVRQSRNILDSVGATVLGVVLNNIVMREDDARELANSGDPEAQARGESRSARVGL